MIFKMIGGSKTRKHHKHKHHKKTRKIKFKPDKCSPKTNHDELDFTCYSKSALHKLKTTWNARHPDVKIYSNDPRKYGNI